MDRKFSYHLKAGQTVYQAFKFAFSLSKGERLSRSWFDKLTTNDLSSNCPTLSW